LAFVAASSCSRINEPVVATVDGEDITASELRETMKMEIGKFDSALLTQEQNFAVFRRQVLDKLAQEKMLIAEARRVGVSISKQERKKLDALTANSISSRGGNIAISEHGVDPEAWRRAQDRRHVIGKLIAQEVIDKVPISEEKVRAHYEANIRDFAQPAQFRARQIIVDSRELADKILAEIKDGEDFADLAKKHSLSPDSKKGGDLGFFDARSYPSVFAEVCGQLKIGEVSEVTPTDYGYQIFQLLEKRPARTITFEEAAAGIRRRLREEASAGSFEKWISDVEKRHKVVVNEEALKGVSLEKRS